MDSTGTHRDSGRRHGRHVWLGGQDPPVHLAQLSPGFHPQFADQGLACVPVDPQRLGLESALIAGGHQLRPDMLAQRMLGD
jgi:hypothetical protein